MSEVNKAITLQQAKTLYDDLRERQENIPSAENIVMVQDQQPTIPANKVWLTETPPAGVDVPTYGEFTGVIAPDYADLDFPVSAGEHCIHNGVLYTAVQNINTSEAWTAAHWEAGSVSSKLTEISSAINGINGIIGNTQIEVITMPSGYKNANYENGSHTRKFKFIDSKLQIYNSEPDTGNLPLRELSISTASLSLGDSLAIKLTNDNDPVLRFDYQNDAGTNTSIIIRYYDLNYSGTKSVSVYLPIGTATKEINIKELAEENEVNITSYPNVVIRGMQIASHKSTAAETVQIDVYGFVTYVQGERIDDRVDDLEVSVDGMTEATAEDVGKALKAKTIENGKVTEWEFGTVQEKEPADLYALRKDVPSYYLAYPSSPASFDEQEYLEEKIKSVPAGKSFIFVTDTHWESNNKHTFDLIRYVKEKLGISKVVFGGDLIDIENNKYKGLNIVRDFMNIAVQALGTDFIPAVGNHDNNMGNVITSGLDSATYRIPYDLLFNTMIKHLEGVAVFEDKSTAISSVALTDADASELTGWSKLHYYVDDEENHTRYIVIYSSCPDDVFLPNYTGFAWDGGGGPTTVMQIDWFADTLSHTPAGYDVIVVAHCADAENTTFPARQQLRSYFEHFVHIASAVHQKCSGYKINVSSFDETSCPSNAFWTRETKQWDFSNVPTLGKILFMAGHIHRNAEYVTRIDTASTTNPTFVKGKARNNGNPALVGSVEGVEVFDSATVDFDSGEILTIITQNDAYIQATGSKYTAELATMTQNTITDQCFDVITLTDSGVVCTRFGAGWDRTIPVKWLPSN